MHYILGGKFTTVFPYSLREENYEKIRQNLDRIDFRQTSIEKFINDFDSEISVYNLSDIFEYMTLEGMDALYETLLKKARKGARLAYWNMLAERKCSDRLCEEYGVTTDDELNAEFLFRDKAFFYSKFYLDVVK
jgi:S-adenosylmethionine-diacylglycerol 3-amino-3-carboxypropyl transferase